MTNIMPSSNQNQEPHEQDGDKQRKQAALAAAVIIVTSFIVVAWIMYLPFQLQKFSILSDEELVRWQEIREDASEEASLQEALSGLRDSYDALEGHYKESGSNQDYGTGRVPQEVIDRLRERLEDIQPNEDSLIDVGTVAEEE